LSLEKQLSIIESERALLLFGALATDAEQWHYVQAVTDIDKTIKPFNVRVL
jgi:hypothetical protein